LSPHAQTDCDEQAHTHDRQQGAKREHIGTQTEKIIKNSNFICTIRNKSLLLGRGYPFDTQHINLQ
jgi:hypothetical protein